MTEKEKFLEQYYYDISNPAAYTTPSKLYTALKGNKEFKFSKYFIKNWLQKQDAYTLKFDDRLESQISELVDKMFSGAWISWMCKTCRKKMMTLNTYLF